MGARQDKQKLAYAIIGALDIWHDIYSPDGAPRPTREMALVKTKLQEAKMWLDEDHRQSPPEVENGR